MNDSKYNDYERQIWREIIKYIYYLPYSGAIVAGNSSASYLQFLGADENSIECGYDTISVKRVREAVLNQPGAMQFQQRHFVVVARLIKKKNIFTAISAFAIYSNIEGSPQRRMVICGSGPLEHELKKWASECGVGESIDFVGFLQSPEICSIIASSIALILPSTEEQFGIVIAEAVALGIPVIVSENCGARETLVRTGVNGFIVEPLNAQGFADFMYLLSTDEQLWCYMSNNSAAFAGRADVSNFAKSVQRLLTR